jgi:hypothetical protein
MDWAKRQFLDDLVPVPAAFGIWMDWANQGTRITGNIIYDTQAANIFLEMDHGPILVDNNMLVGQGVMSLSEGCVFVHNLFVDCKFIMLSDAIRSSEYYKPHTRKIIGSKPGIPSDHKWFNNVFVRRGLKGVNKAPGYSADYNVFMDGAKKSSFGDDHSVVDSLESKFRQEDSPLGVSLRFQVSQTSLRINAPWVDGALVGILPTVGQTIENASGQAIRVDTDLLGQTRAAPVAGPLANLKPGENMLLWSIKK